MDKKLNINLDELPTVKCKECDGKDWVEKYTVKKVSALMSPNGKEGVIPVPNMVCDYCGSLLQDSLENEEQTPNNIKVVK